MLYQLDREAVRYGKLESVHGNQPKSDSSTCGKNVLFWEQEGMLLVGFSVRQESSARCVKIKHRRRRHAL